MQMQLFFQLQWPINNGSFKAFVDVAIVNFAAFALAQPKKTTKNSKCNSTFAVAFVVFESATTHATANDTFAFSRNIKGSFFCVI